MSKRRNRYSSELKAKVALAALRNAETMAELDVRFGNHPTIVKGRKPSFPGSGAKTFSPFNPV